MRIYDECLVEIVPVCARKRTRTKKRMDGTEVCDLLYNELVLTK